MSEIRFDYDGTHYCLEVTPNTLKRMEKSGVNFSELGDKLIAAETLWKGLFIAHHIAVPDKKRMEIYRALKKTEDGKDEPEIDEETGEQIDMLLSAVGKLYEEAFEDLKNQRGQGNVSWKLT